MSATPISFTDYDAGFDRGPYVAGIVVLAVGFVVLAAIFAVALLLAERHGKKVDDGTLMDPNIIASVRRQRGSIGSGEEGEEDEEEEEEEDDDDDGAAAA